MALSGTLVVSLDFELHWGVCDKVSVEQYRASLLGVRRAVPALLELFAEYEIGVTWATVGLLFFRDAAELRAGLPRTRPTYQEPQLSPYPMIDRGEIGENERDDPFHFGHDLIAAILRAPRQEIGTHTFSHFYCLEPGQTAEQFRQDLAAAAGAAQRYAIRLRSVVFPRNQVRDDYLPLCGEIGIRCYRGNEPGWMYRARAGAIQPWHARGARLLDNYVSLSGPNTVSEDAIRRAAPYNIASSRFLRPYSPALRRLEPLRFRRIAAAMTHAAKRREVFHLWWHPHNFGVHLSENLAFLRRIFDHYRTLQAAYGMESLSMGELAGVLDGAAAHG